MTTWIITAIVAALFAPLVALWAWGATIALRRWCRRRRRGSVMVVTRIVGAKS